MKSVRVGIDLGGSRLKACAAGPGGACVASTELPAVPWRDIPAVLPRVLRRLRCGRPAALTVGAKGIWHEADRRWLARRLAGKAGEVTVVSDLELAHAGAFSGGPGVLVVGGTGSSAFALDARGRRARAGGWGPLIGDDGSAFWLGREALRDAGLRRRLRADPLVLGRGPDALRKVAGVARDLLRLARTDRRARRLRRQAARMLAELAAEAAAGLAFAGRAPVSWTGGLFDDAGLRADFLAAARRRGLAPQAPLVRPECAAALWR